LSESNKAKETKKAQDDVNGSLSGVQPIEPKAINATNAPTGLKGAGCLIEKNMKENYEEVNTNLMPLRNYCIREPNLDHQA
jgi:hypothetical protein